MADANVYVRYLADASKLVTETKKGGKSVDRFGDQTAKADKSFGGFAGRVATFAAGTAIVAGLSSWAAEGVKLADTADLVRKSWDKTFGAGGDQLTMQLEAQRKALGLAEFEMQQLLVTTGQLAQQQGMSKEESGAFAAQLFSMAGDVAAFTGNLDAAPEVLGAFQAALRGEFDPLEQYGIKLSAAAIEQQALKDTGKASTKELTAQEKQAAILTLIMQALADETGALAEAQADGATKANELTAEMRDQQEAVGQAGQIIKSAFNSALLAAIEGLQSFGKWIAETMMSLRALGEGSGPIALVARALSDLLQWMFGVGDGAERMAGRFRRAIAPLKAVADGVASAVRGISSAYGAVSGFAGRVGGMLGFAQGGVVPGQPGQPQLAVVHGGERVLTAAQQRESGGGAGGGQVINVTVNAGLANPYETATAIVDLLRVYQRTQGPLPYAANQFGSV